MNVVDGNLVLLTRVSDTLLNTDTTPASFWITNPNNTYTNNHAGGSTNGYGFWYQLDTNPTGPSATTSVCPKFTALGEFSNNTAHSNMFYGLRIHPEFYPKQDPCRKINSAGGYNQVPAVFNGLMSYKNGVKGAIATQVGLIQFRDFVIVDNGAGPLMHKVNGKDQGGGIEMSWIVDDRNRYNVQYSQMAGVTNSIVVARTSQGQAGTAGQWNSSRQISAITTQSPVQADSKHSALLSIMNVTFVDFAGGQFTCLEACGKCKHFQGGAPTFLGGLSFLQNGVPTLSKWAWGHQGVYIDTDGTLLNEKTLPSNLLPSNFSLGPGSTWHSAVDSNLFSPDECSYVKDQITSDDGAFCSPDLTFRRVMLNNHANTVEAGSTNNLLYRDLLVTSPRTNRTSIVHFIVYNENGYQFTVPTGRDHEVHWASPYRMDAITFTVHKPDLLDNDGFVLLTSKYIQKMNNIQVYQAFGISGAAPTVAANLIHPLTPTSPYGSSFYNQTFAPNYWWYWNNSISNTTGFRSYNDTSFQLMIAGTADDPLTTRANICPLEGCSYLPDVVVDVREGLLLWSEAATWNETDLGHIPEEGDNVTIPQGWNLVIDVSPPALNAVVIQGNVTFKASSLTILLNGTRQTADWAIGKDLNLGSKVLAAISGGRIDMYGNPGVQQRWTRLGAEALIGDTAIVVASPMPGWAIGNHVLITSTTFNPWQAETRRIVGVGLDKRSFILDTALNFNHTAKVRSYSNSSATIDMRAESLFIPINVDILLIGTEGDGAFSFWTDPDRLLEALTQSHLDICPTIWETGQETAVCFSVNYEILSTPDTALSQLEAAIRSTLLKTNSTKEDVPKDGLRKTLVPVYDIEASGAIEDKIQNILEESPCLAQPHDLLILIKLQPHKAKERPSLISEEEGQRLSEMHEDFVMEWVNSGPSEYGPLASASGTVTPASIPRILPLMVRMAREVQAEGLDATAHDHILEEALEGQHNIMRGALAEVLSSATHHLFCPDIKMARIEHAAQILVPIIAIHDDDGFDGIGGASRMENGFQYALNLVDVQQAMDMMIDSNQYAAMDMMIDSNQYAVQEESVAMMLDSHQYAVQEKGRLGKCLRETGGGVAGNDYAYADFDPDSNAAPPSQRRNSSPQGESHQGVNSRACRRSRASTLMGVGVPGPQLSWVSAFQGVNSRACRRSRASTLMGAGNPGAGAIRSQMIHLDSKVLLRELLMASPMLSALTRQVAKPYLAQRGQIQLRLKRSYFARDIAAIRERS
eukprot:gene18974-25550_t